MPLACIMFKSSRKFLKDDYDIGWFVANIDTPYILVWGNTKNKESANKLAKNIIKRQGERDIIFYDEYVNNGKNNSNLIMLSKDELEKIRARMSYMHKGFIRIT